MTELKPFTIGWWLCLLSHCTSQATGHAQRGEYHDPHYHRMQTMELAIRDRIVREYADRDAAAK